MGHPVDYKRYWFVSGVIGTTAHKDISRGEKCDSFSIRPWIDQETAGALPPLLPLPCSWFSLWSITSIHEGFEVLCLENTYNCSAFWTSWHHYVDGFECLFRTWGLVKYTRARQKTRCGDGQAPNSQCSSYAPWDVWGIWRFSLRIFTIRVSTGLHLKEYSYVSINFLNLIRPVLCSVVWDSSVWKLSAWHQMILCSNPKNTAGSHLLSKLCLVSLDCYI